MKVYFIKQCVLICLCVYAICRWITSSRRPQTWTTWRSCMKAGRRGCERDFHIGLLRFQHGLEIHQNPPGLGLRSHRAACGQKKRGFGGALRPSRAPTRDLPPPVAQQQIRKTPTTRFSGLHPSPCKRAKGGDTEDREGGCGG